MRLYVSESPSESTKKVVLDDMILTKDMPTSAGSKMLEGYMSLFEAEVVTRLKTEGYEISGKANTGEFSLDLLGETSYYGVCTTEDGTLTNGMAEILKNGEVKAGVTLDVNGTPRRAAAIAGLTYIKPTYGTVSRYGTIPTVCSGETVGVMAQKPSDCREVLSVLAGHDAKDGTSLPEEKCSLLKASAERETVKKVVLAKSLLAGIDEKMAARIEQWKTLAEKAGVQVVEIEGELLPYAQIAWNILMSAEVTNNVSRYDGIKFGYRTPNYEDIDELYTNSRTEAFGYLTKSTVLFGSDTLSTDNYMPVYDKALRVRRVISEVIYDILKDADGILMPACSKMTYDAAEVKAAPYTAYEESFYTAPASITGLPVLVSGGVQLIGRPFSENSLLDLAELLVKEDK